MPFEEILPLAIWWCEGTKIRRDKRWKNAFVYSVEVINTDYRIIKIFLDYLVKTFEVSREKFKGQIQIHEGDNLESVESFWCSKLKMGKSQLNKTIIRPIGNKPKKNNGTFKLRLHDKSVFLELQRRLELALVNKL